MKKRYLLFLPFTLLFISPWMTRLAYENINLAMPTLHPSYGDVMGAEIGILLVCGLVAFYLLMENPNDPRP